MEIIKRMAAARAGKMMYYTGKPCKYGHTTGRYTSTGACIQCLSESSQAQREEIREALKAAKHNKGEV
jgi:hypothetical protein